MIVQAAQRARVAANSLGARVLTTPGHRAVFSSALLIGILTLLVKAVTLGRDMMVASHFGTSDANDAFLAGWVLPGFLVGIVSGGFVGAIIPVQIDVRNKSGKSREEAVLGEVMLLSALSYLIITGFLLATSKYLLPLVTQGYSSSKYELALQISMVMMPAILIGGMAAIWSAMLNTKNRFGLVAISPMVVPAVTAVVLLASPDAQIEWLAVGMVIGNGLQAAVLFLGLHREGMPVSFGWHGFLPETRSILSQFGILAANGIIFNGLGVVDTAMAATLGSGSQSTLLYANKLIAPLLGISSIALGTAVFPYFSRLVADEDWDGLRHTLQTYTRLILAVAIPTTIGIILFARPVVRLLFERGEFTPEDTENVSRVLATYSFLVPIETIAVMMSRVVISLRAGRIMVYASIGIFVFNIASDLILKELIGIQGIALATVLNQLISLVFLIFLLQHLKKTKMGPK